MKIAARIILALAFALLAFECSNKINQPTNLPDPNSFTPETTYLIVTPAWTEADGIPFHYPSDVKIGYDGYAYVADRDNNRVVKMTLTGQYVESYPVQHPTQVTQDRGLDLLVVTDSSAILRRHYRDAGDFEVVFTAPDVLLPPPLNRFAPAALYGIAASPFPDKSYLITHYYNNEIYRFGSQDSLRGVQVEAGFGPGRILYPVCVNSYNFDGFYYICFTSGGSSYSVQVINGLTGQPVIPDSASIYRPLIGIDGYKDVALDRLGNIFVAIRSDSQVWKFSRNGSLKLKFGQDGGEADHLNSPSGIDIYQNYIYVADAGNNRVVRFEISTTPQQ